MQVTVNEKSKIVEMWLTKAERDDVQFRETLKPMYATLKQKISGCGVLVRRR